MNRLTHLFLVLLLACLPASLLAQDKANDDNDDNDDSRYLVGAVPEVEGKVIFSKEFSINGMTQDQVFDRVQNWMTARLKENKNVDSRVVYADKEKGIIAGVGEEWIVFKSSALSLDRTLVNYQITVNCQPAKCIMEIEKIRYTYRDKDKYIAEEWITDKYALNKAKTKLVRGLAKWRKKTVDFSDDLFAEVAQALGAPEAKPVAEKTPKKAAVTATSGPIVITTATPVTVTTPTLTTPPTENKIPGYQPVAPNQIPASAIQMGAGKLVIAIGTDAFNMTMMTANAGGSLGKISDKPVVFSILSPDQPYEQLEKADTYSVRFYPTNQAEPSVIIECKKLSSQAPMEGQPRTYVGEIVKAWIK